MVVSVFGVILYPFDHVTPLTEGILKIVGLMRSPEAVRTNSKKSEIFLLVLPTRFAIWEKDFPKKVGSYGLLVLGSSDPERDCFGSCECVSACVHVGRVAGEGEGDLPDGGQSLVERAEGVENADVYGLSGSYQNGA